MTFDAYFEKASGFAPFPYQRRLATGPAWPARIEVPTGLGKTAAVVLAHLYRRGHSEHRGSTPRRLVYCLPMRVLVEQTVASVRAWVERLGLDVRVATLMGGAIDEAWDLHPEADAVIVGTQDQLLSRALNRGYGMSRYRWPMHFGLLNGDCRWIIDEVQLVGSGVATSAQLQAMRRRLGTALPVSTTWMSATLEDSWLRSVDVEDADLEGLVTLAADDRAEPRAARRLDCTKHLSRARSSVGDSRQLAVEVVEAHRQATLTLAIANTVDRATELFRAIEKQKPAARLVLVHGRFRAHERSGHVAALLERPSGEGTIAVSTQVIEAGVDVSAATLFTEIAPWASLVQRFGRCNRYGEVEDARIFWVGLPEAEKDRKRIEKPYDLSDLVEAEGALEPLSNAGPAALPRRSMRIEQGLVLRRRDLVDLFDTTPDLMGSDIDVSRFIRDTDDHDVRVYWRAFDDDAPGREEHPPKREELCAAPVQVVKEWVRSKKAHGLWAWDPLRACFRPVDGPHPGMTVLLHSGDGGYSSHWGLDPKDASLVPPVPASIEPVYEDVDQAYDEDALSSDRPWYTLKAHSLDVAREAAHIAESVGLGEELGRALVEAAQWHDAGKAHPVWQAAARNQATDSPAELVAKSATARGSIVYRRDVGERTVRVPLRHELASALMALEHGRSDLVCFLIASHHGKVRVSIRSTPTEPRPNDADRRFARGVWDGDQIPVVDLGEGVVVPETTLRLSYMDLGDDPQTGPSWLSRILGLRDDPNLGPFRLAFLEALIKCADERASIRAAGKEIP
jgi:CRISPR-associated endonuclease/helicase Cas3